MPTRYWVIAASRDHVQRGIEGGFTQANHGKAAPLRRMQPGDKIVFYSSKAVYGEDTKCQCFTAIGEVADGDVYQADMGGGFEPFRRNVTFWHCREVSLLPLIPQLSFIKDKQRWGAPFRWGAFEMPHADYELIAREMLAQSS
jgi:predicted RNA-binding protein